jgi:hypothetical protein
MDDNKDSTVSSIVGLSGSGGDSYRVHFVFIWCSLRGGSKVFIIGALLLGTTKAAKDYAWN